MAKNKRDTSPERDATAFPIHVIGDYAVDELIPSSATVPLNTKDPALWTLRVVDDDAVKPVPGGAWFQWRMMQSICCAWEQWRNDLNKHIVEDHLAKVKAKEASGCPPVVLRETDFQRQWGTLPDEVTEPRSILKLKSPRRLITKKPHI